jgi:acyl-coenzyme A synthetase/AMP-(fatty) acid ligase
MLCFQRYLAIKHHHHLLYSPHTLGEQKRYTFKSFKDEVDSLAASLLELGFEKNDRFAVWLPNTSENVAMTFAASKLGLIKVKSLLEFPNIIVHMDHR